jgi:DNA-binding MarR family transcriptional regulator
VIDDSGLSFIQMKTVVTLGGAESNGDATTVTALAETLGVSNASASRAADGLVKKKLATRVEDPEDRRVRRLELTARGRELADRIVSARLAGIEDFTASLECAERTKLAAALDALMEREELAHIYRGNSERAER